MEVEDNKLLEKNKKVKKRIIIGFIVLILLNLWGSIKVNSLRQDLDSLRGDIYNQYNDMRTSLSSINTIVEENLKKQGKYFK